MKQDDRQLIRSKVMQSIDMSGDIGDEQVSDMIDRCILESESGNVLSVRRILLMNHSGLWLSRSLFRYS